MAINVQSIIGGPKNHWVTEIHQTVARAYRNSALTFDEDRRRLMCIRKTRVVHSHPYLTKKTLKRLRLCEKKELVDAGEGENTEKVEPSMRVKGYIDAMRISVGENRLGLGEVDDRDGGWGMLSSGFSAS